MNQSILQFIATLVVIALLNGCGGGDSGGDNNKDTVLLPQNIWLTGTDGALTVEWDGQEGYRYDLYLAQASGVNPDNYAELSGGIAYEQIASPFSVSELVPGTTLYLVMQTTDTKKHSALSKEYEFKVMKTLAGAVLPALGDSKAWNIHLRPDGSACGGASNCVAAGLLRALAVEGMTSCDGVTAQDALQLLTWSCEVTETGIRLVSTGLQPGKGLADIIDADNKQLRSNILYLITGGEDEIYLGRTESTPWWDNAIIAVDETTKDFNTAYGLYILPDTLADGAYTISADGVMLYSANSTQLHGSVSASGVNDVVISNLTINANGHNNGLAMTNSRYAVIEHVSVALADQNGVRLDNVDYSRVSGLNSAANAISGLVLQNADGNRVDDYRVSANGDVGVALYSAQNNQLLNGQVANNASSGVLLSRLGTGTGSDGNRLTGLVSSNNGVNGVTVSNSINVHVQNVTASNNSASGLAISSSANAQIQNVTATNNGGMGVELASSATNKLARVLVANNGSNGVVLNNADNFVLRDVVAVGHVNQSYGSGLGVLIYDTSTGGSVGGILKVGNNTFNCVIHNVVLCGHDDIAHSMTFTATVIDNVNVAKTFKAKSTVGGPNETGMAAYDDITDWLNPGHAYLAWGKDGTTDFAFPDLSQSGACVSGDTCRLWDWRLATGDSGDNGSPVALGVLALPASVSGGVLNNAIELIGDGRGNDDGHCQNGEACLYTPNIGAYQGEGGVVNVKTDGSDYTIDGVADFAVRLYRYAQNGAR